MQTLIPKGQRFQFAEANKEFVGFLFHIFSLPLGTLIDFSGSKRGVGRSGKLKESIDTFNYFQPGINKDDIFNPKTAFNGNTLLLPYAAPFVEQSGASKETYRCSSICKNSKCHKYISVYADSRCPGCRSTMDAKMIPVLPDDKMMGAEVSHFFWENDKMLR